MLEIRYDSIKAIKVAYATKRQGRTFYPPKDYYEKKGKCIHCA